MAPPSDIQQKDAKQALAEDGYDDCTACRVTGAAAFIGLGVYSYHTGMSNLRKQEAAIMQSSTKYKMGSRRMGIATISLSLIGLGIWRGFN
ncbi:hypothetical protein N7462_007895 [Penicillium macrosclerotiorum]|uniref:uncharacterized protein n=1 Tax=Penicillium macrosclerotiorum TaxID=303699 RepID=UPI002548C80C|nr:uncharacterized protein N7462_007895 [Penicillium macrosclerotiorum]KAJ5679651.1 hypothetical protein N7462_007895 [Penicillium macrosclerotiorum]